MGRPVLNLLRLARMPIYTQLHLEEALLRATKDNWLIVNDGAFNPAIVIGISGWVSWGEGLPVWGSTWRQAAGPAGQTVH